MASSRHVLLIGACACAVSAVFAIYTLNQSGGSPMPPVVQPNAGASSPEYVPRPDSELASKRAALPALATNADATPATLEHTSSLEQPETLEGIELEQDRMKVKWRMLRYELQLYRKLSASNPINDRMGSLITDSIGAILEASGRGISLSAGRPNTPNTYYVVMKDLAYTWPVGEFPEYDAYYQYKFAIADYEEASMKTPDFKGTSPTFDIANCALIEARAVEAILLLESRFGFSVASKQ